MKNYYEEVYIGPYPFVFLQEYHINYYEAVHVYKKNNNQGKIIDFKDVMEMRKGRKGLFDE